MKHVAALVLVASVLLAMLVGYEMAGAFLQRTDGGPVLFNSNEPAPSPEPISFVRMPLPAVSRSGVGALAVLELRLTNGEGNVYYQFDERNPLTNPDTQYSLRTALDVGKQLSGVSAISSYDLYFSLSADSEVVGGESAGAAMAVGTLALFRGESLRDDVLITGSVSPDGSIGRVGRILEKALVARESGFSEILVPVGEKLQPQNKQVCQNEVIDDTYYQTCTTQRVVIDVASETGMKVTEVSDVLEAYRLMVVEKG
ncbi:hypothetical protein KJ765_06080 [Candidatus Micrarchaeota archaeon]|nr:hypothetical protein [Candidatus Micrarchaeota archaeon]